MEPYNSTKKGANLIFNVRVTKDMVRITSAPDYPKRGFVKRLPTVLAQRPRALVEKFLGDEITTGPIEVVLNRAGKYVVGEVSFGNRHGKKHQGPDEVVYKTKIITNRDNGVGIRLCILPDEFVGKRVDVIHE